MIECRTDINYEYENVHDCYIAYKAQRTIQYIGSRAHLGLLYHCRLSLTHFWSCRVFCCSRNRGPISDLKVLWTELGFDDNERDWTSFEQQDLKGFESFQNFGFEIWIFSNFWGKRLSPAVSHQLSDHRHLTSNQTKCGLPKQTKSPNRQWRI